MIEATCAACGSVNRIAEADVPVGAKFVSCTSCKSKVALPAKPASGAAPARPAAKPVAIPTIPTKLPTPPRGVPAPPSKATIDLADLPAPKRQSPLAGAEASKPAPRSALSGAELPVPKGAAKPPAPQTGSLDLDDLMPPDAPASAGLADLPAPKRASGLGDAGKPAPKSPLGDAGKPAPKSPLGDAGKPASKSPLGDAVKAAAALADLPTPKRPAADLSDLPAPKKPAGITDLPAPKKPAGITDLPAPKKPAADLSDLPMPKPIARPALELDDDLDLPMPKPGANNDLLMPKPGANGDLPMPKPGANNDQLAPKGFFDDLPQPAKKQPGGIDLPAPKGFFDDLPQPAMTNKSQDVAPKGFFDDLPQPAKTTSQNVAPKGLFDDLPQPNKAAAASVGGGLFDDLPQPNKSAADLALGAGDIDLGPVGSTPGLELDSGGPGLDLHAGGGPELDLGAPLDDGAAFQDLDLSEPTAGKPKPVEEPSPIKIKSPGKGGPSKPIAINVPPKPGADMKLDLADDPHDGRAGTPGIGAAAATAHKITPKKKTATAEETAEQRAAKRRRSRIVLGALLGVVALGAGGFYFYQRHAAAQAKAAEIERQLQSAEKALKADDARHWQRARAAADEALKLDATNAKALGIAAEAAIAGAIDDGTNWDARIAQGRGMIQDALGAGHPSPQLERAQAVAAIIAKGQAQRAIDLLKGQLGKNPKDGWLQLYLGWAQLAKGDAAEATKAFDQAIALAPATKLPALYGEGQAKLLLADIAGARTAFESILAINKDHVCANVGLIATKPASQAMEQVAELEAVLQRKDVTTKQADPRCVVKALTLIGDVHRGAGRLDMARQRYRDALKLVANDVPTLDGLAAVELRDNKPQVAADLIQKALAADAESGETQLLQAELAVRQGKLPDAQTLIDKLAARQPPLPTLAQAHLFVVRGNLLEAKGQDEDAITAYVEGSKLAGDLDLTPVMSAVKKLSELAKKADPAKATEYRNRIDELLKALEQRALEDAQLSTALGVAYLEAGDPAKADNFLRRAVALKGDDPESKLQFARALAAEGKIDEAVSQLKEAQQLDPKRIDIALELARTYQVANRHDDAVAAYDKLLALPDVPIVVRVNAGRYYAQRGMIDKAAAQAEPILKAEPENPGGLYLKAEGLLKADKPEEAGPILTKATDIEADAQYLDALGRALEARYFKSNDGKYIEGARFAYERASKADPKMFHPWLGQGKMLVERKDWDAAVKPLLAASAIDASNASVLYYQGRAYFGLRNAKPEYKKVSAQWLESALKARPELDLASRAEASHLLGELYEDLNKPQDNVRAWENALRLGEEIEKQTGKAPEWLTETYYDLGDLFERLSSFPAQKRVFQRYLDRNPKNATHKTAVQQALLTRLKQY